MELLISVLNTACWVCAFIFSCGLVVANATMISLSIIAFFSKEFSGNLSSKVFWFVVFAGLLPFTIRLALFFYLKI